MKTSKHTTFHIAKAKAEQFRKDRAQAQAILTRERGTAVNLEDVPGEALRFFVGFHAKAERVFVTAAMPKPLTPERIAEIVC